MPTLFEKNLIQQRRTQGVIRPLLEEMMKTQVGIETEEDALWLSKLAQRIVEREEIRKNGQGVFSPSGLASCLRRVYLGRHWQQLGLERIVLPNISVHGYFLEGDFKHLKWQYALYRLSKINPDFILLDCEVPVISKRGDHGGTIDVVVVYQGKTYIIDIKGLNVYGFQQIVRGKTPAAYRIQLTDYAMLFNAQLKLSQNTEIRPCQDALLLVESKGGPDKDHPLAIHEANISIKDNLPEVRARLKILREHESKEEIPEIECISTKSSDFQSCPYADFCRKEVKAEERRRIASENSHPVKLKVSRPKRANRSG